MHRREFLTQAAMLALASSALPVVAEQFEGASPEPGEEVRWHKPLEIVIDAEDPEAQKVRLRFDGLVSVGVLVQRVELRTWQPLYVRQLPEGRALRTGPTAGKLQFSNINAPAQRVNPLVNLLEGPHTMRIHWGDPSPDAHDLDIEFIVTSCRKGEKIAEHVHLQDIEAEVLSIRDINGNSLLGPSGPVVVA